MSSGKSREVAMNWGLAEIDRSNPNPNFSFGYVTEEKDLEAFSVVVTVNQWKGNRVWIEEEDRREVREMQKIKEMEGKGWRWVGHVASRKMSVGDLGVLIGRAA
jgi:hypothetical protein